MPTENRSSNTELISQAAAAIEDLLANGTGAIAAAAWASLPTDLRKLTAQPSPQPHPEPIAWMVGTAFWWTKEEAERDAAETGLPIVGLGPMTDTGAIDQLSQIIRDLNDERDEIGAEAGRLRAKLAELEALHGGELGLPKEGWPEYHKRKMETLRGLTAGYYQRKLAERDTLIDEVLKAFQLNADGNGSCHNPGLSFIRPWAERVAALSASAEPRATTPQTINGHKLNCKAVDDYKPG